MENRESGQLAHNEKFVKAVYIILRVLVVVILIARLLDRDFESAALCVLTLALFLLPNYFERKLHFDLPDALEVLVLLFIFAAEILGEIRSYYVTYPFWDSMLHTINGFVCSALGFCLVDVLNRKSKITTFSLSPAYMALAAFCFSMTIGVLWEFVERAVDTFILYDMQKDTVLNLISTVKLDPEGGTHAIVVRDIADVILVHSDGSQEALGLGGYLDIGLIDTMKDLFVNFIGAAVFSVIGYFYVKRRGEGKIARQFIPQVRRGDQDPE